MFPETSDDVARKLQQLLGTSMNNNSSSSSKRTSRQVPFKPRDERPNGFVVSSVGNGINNNDASSGGACRSTQVMDKCRMLTEQMTQLTASVQSRAAHDSGYDVRRFNSNELEEIKLSLGHYRNERRASQSPPPPTSQPPTTTTTTTHAATAFDPESFLARKIKQAHAERDFLDRSTTDFKSRVLAEFGRQQL
ncbi:hypothetical protein BDB00DRAFT_485187 [Zychaea mexicana]|uniref:uncharacterized protein n=1 Tax=Zychaea mexicana TaxID=64656 RepID=UPI0022FEAD58|nr:uncharacterized protein BDB00DRAFT_485187 [Zychaea mexicana]KAI9491505.1 hypothetical protein BDB00DRAFT_485187 [Zychaea mexicana]